MGQLPHRSIQSLSRRHGPLMLLHFGKVPVLVASSSEAAREIMKNQDLIFASRPKMSIPARLLYNCRDVAFAPYGEYWRRIRSVCVLHLLSSKRVQSFRRVMEEETSLMVEKIRSSSTGVINLRDAVASMTNDVISLVSLGKKSGGGERNFHRIIAELEELLGVVPLWEYIPWLSWMRRFDGVDGRIERVAKALDQFLESVIEEHRVRERSECDGDELDFVDILLDFQRENENGSGSSVDDDTIKAIILIKIEERDLEKMLYLKAVTKESLRLHPPLPLLVPRELTQDTKVLGYDIVSGTRVLINAWAIARDSLLWEKPEQFYPERFLETNIDYKGLHFELTPFGSGRRGCPGVTFATTVYELALAKLVYNFDFELPNGVKIEELDVSESSGLTMHKKFPLLVVVSPRTC
ncbi:hypothetical protein SASPL_153571 [Salvia splendens]|uniref:Uncharacterized protein n=1 Tax=Salvia splendens TaxID=180675 RepID=A0A8X8VYJ3_SALSN|nr:hypothetical protein SASPL_153571 [Salvia splendens]